MASGVLKDYLGVGLASARPSTLSLEAGVAGYWYATDTGALSVWNGAAWTAVSGGGAALNVKDEGVSTVNPASALNFVGAGVTVANAGGGEATITIPGGGGGASWAVAHNAAITGSPITYDVTGLGAYNELMIMVRNFGVAASAIREMQVSVDNGSTFYSASANYRSVAASGAETAATSLMNTAASASARVLYGHLVNTKGATKTCVGVNISGFMGSFIASPSDINALRFTAGGVAITSGDVLVLGR